MKAIQKVNQLEGDLIIRAINRFFDLVENELTDKELYIFRDNPHPCRQATLDRFLADPKAGPVLRWLREQGF